MPPQSKLVRMIERDEGLELHLYKCTAGKLTIGYGHNIEDLGISRQVAELMLQEDCKSAESNCRAIFGTELWEKWSENRRLGWINFCYNLGRSRMLGFKNTLKAAIAQNWNEVESGLRHSMWFSQVKSRAERVIAMICREEFPYG
jgi:lysozyme